MAHHRNTSVASSYAPVLITPARGPPSRATAPAAVEPRLKYPYPLLIAAIFDFGFTVSHGISTAISPFLTTLCLVRVFVLGGVLGCSRSWRSRGGWIAVVCGLTFGTSVWKVCEGQMSRGQRRPGDPKSTETELDAVFLAVTAALAVGEYILFLLLLRLSPPPHRLNPLALRMPHSAVQSPTVFSFHTSQAALDGIQGYAASPSSIRQTRHSRYPSSRTFLQPEDISAGPSRLADDTDDLGSSPDSDAEATLNDYLDENEDDLSDNETSSSISASSIIDLPPPLSPSRIAPPTSLSINGGLNIYAAIDNSPVLGAVVRRTRSARFLGRSWGSRNGDNDEENTSGEGYGTFGRIGGTEMG